MGVINEVGHDLSASRLAAPDPDKDDENDGSVAYRDSSQQEGTGAGFGVRAPRAGIGKTFSRAHSACS